MARTSGRRGKGGAARGGKRAVARRAARPQRQKVCPNPGCPSTKAGDIEELSQIARDVAPADIKLALDDRPAKRCRRCGVVFVQHAGRPDKPVGYFERPTEEARGRVDGWEPPYPYHMPPAD